MPKLLTIVRLAALGAVALAWFAVVAASTPNPSIEVTRASGGPGTAIIIHGTGFPAGEVVALYIDQPDPYLYLNPPPGPRAAADGTITDSLKWPGNTYDSSHHVDPTKPGVHTVCGDTGYPGSTQAIAVKACTQFTVLDSTGPQTTSDNGPSLPLPLIGAGIVVVIILGIAGQWLMTRGSQTARRPPKSR